MELSNRMLEMGLVTFEEALDELQEWRDGKRIPDKSSCIVCGGNWLHSIDGKRYCRRHHGEGMRAAKGAQPCTDADAPSAPWTPKVGDWVRCLKLDEPGEVIGVGGAVPIFVESMSGDFAGTILSDFEPWVPRVGERVQHNDGTAGPVFRIKDGAVQYRAGPGQMRWGSIDHLRPAPLESISVEPSKPAPFDIEITVQQSGALRTPCPDCNGSGRYVGLEKIDSCRECGGSGRV